MAYRGRYKPKNPDKYVGDPTDIIYRSSWERAVFKWCDEKDEIVSWSSETVVIPYRCKTDGKIHRYFVDLLIKFNNGKTILVEIKPHAQTQEPKTPKRKTRRYYAECLTWAKNKSKWEAAEEWALDRGIEFHIWTEKALAKLGILILG